MSNTPPILIGSEGLLLALLNDNATPGLANFAGTKSAPELWVRRSGRDKEPKLIGVIDTRSLPLADAERIIDEWTALEVIS